MRLQNTHGWIGVAGLVEMFKTDGVHQLYFLSCMCGSPPSGLQGLPHAITHSRVEFALLF